MDHDRLDHLRKTILTMTAAELTGLEDQLRRQGELSAVAHIIALRRAMLAGAVR